MRIYTLSCCLIVISVVNNYPVCVCAMGLRNRFSLSVCQSISSVNTLKSVAHDNPKIKTYV